MVSVCGSQDCGRRVSDMPGAQRSPDDDADDADDAVEEISTDDGRDLGDVSEVAGQLAGATSQIAEQLSMITEAAQPGQSAVWARAAARLLCLLHLAAVGSSALPGSGRPTGHPAPHDHGGAMSDTSPMRPASRRGPSG